MQKTIFLDWTPLIVYIYLKMREPFEKFSDFYRLSRSTNCKLPSTNNVFHSCFTGDKDFTIGHRETGFISVIFCCDLFQFASCTWTAQSWLPRLKKKKIIRRYLHSTSSQSFLFCDWKYYLLIVAVTVKIS